MEHPILFSAPMVRAILAGQKTETRRVFKVGKYAITSPLETVEMCSDGTAMYISTGGSSGPYLCPYGSKGMNLWVRETWRVGKPFDKMKPRNLAANNNVVHQLTVDYLADEKSVWDKDYRGKIRPSIFMPRWASRIALEITNIRVERLQDISHESAINEAALFWAKCEKIDADFRAQHLLLDQLAFSYLWESINGAGSWVKNPWVWVIQFKKIAL